MKLSAYPEVKTGVSAHPSHPAIMGGLRESEKEAYEAIKDSPQVRSILLYCIVLSITTKLGLSYALAVHAIRD